ncbi:hypothetical protein TGAMA5MH_10826 [Trichoderma gamsii]|uniref:NACHT domain-containing protein n=1 Tax=Trichoderma gamsii TaxID=398673 RepID=A0A2K0SVE7_9HYPO|nr:hypothetical protein TGAMA5MH_10826 [Trichoderma gamsii]
MRHLRSSIERLRRQKAKFRSSNSKASSLDSSTAQDGNKQTDESILSNAIPASMKSVDALPTPAASVPAASKAHFGLEPRPQPSFVIVHNASLPEHLWDRAYDELKENETSEAALVQAYEKILSRHLRDRDPASDNDIDEENIIAQDDPGARRTQMNQLVTSGLAKIKRETKIKESVDKGVQVIMSAKDIISSAIQTVPQAALAWTGVCVALEIFGNSTSATKANRNGIDYVIGRMQWYWELPDTIFKNNVDAYNHLSKMRGGLEAQLIGLYKLLLLYQMKSVCSYYKNRGLVFLRDIAKLDDWDGDIKAIEKAETLFYKDSGVHRKEKMNANLEHIVTYVKQKMTKEDLQCFKDLGITDPSYDKKRIESTKGGLLEQSYRWILDNADFQQWRDDEERRLLWIRGDPGKGKTMLLCGIADELRRISASSGLISYFFCQATDQRINNANAVLWGLMFMLVDQQPALMRHIRSKYDASGKDLFIGGNSWFALSEIFSDMLRDPALTYAYLLIDALDECTSDREKLLDLVVENLSASCPVKWILSSRNWPEIERQLAESEGLERISLSLEVNADLVSRAVDAYIEHEVSRLRLIKYNPTIKDQVHHQMQQKANGTFLWVALVVKDLRDRQDAEYDDPLNILNILKDMPGDLTSLYSLMVDHIDKLKGDAPSLCKRILSVAALASRPLSLAELRILADFDSNRVNNQAMERLVNKCGSFLTIRDCTVYFVHQSAKDHLIMDKPTQPIIFPSGHSEVHYTILSHSLRAMTPILKKNIYALPHPGSHIDEVEIPNPDPLAAIRYSCAHWIDHICNGISANGSSTYHNYLDDTGPVSVFLHTHFLHWLEALSFLQKISDNVISITRLENLLKVSLSS